MQGSSSFAANFAKLKETDSYETLEESAKNATTSKEASAGQQTTSTSDGVTVSKAASPHAILVSPRQRGNPILKSITNVPWQYEEGIIPDYVMGRTTCALYLSLRYHTLKPDYIAERLKLLGKLYELRVLLVQVDQNDPHHALKHLTRICLLADLTLMLAWSAEEAGRILETYKIYEHKPPELLMGPQESNSNLKVVNALKTVRSVNTTDANNLLKRFGSLKRIIKASSDSIALVPGFGSKKATRLHNALHAPFLKNGKNSSKQKSSSIQKYLTTSQS